MSDGSDCDTEPEVVSVMDSAAASYISQKDLNRMKERMSSEANRAVRDTYRNLLIEQQEKADQAGEAGVSLEELTEMVLTANEAVSSVNRPREATLDAEYLSMCAKLVKTGIENKQFNTTEFYPTDFSKRMITFMQGDEVEANLSDPNIWKRLGKAVSRIYLHASPLETAYAGIDHEMPKKVRQARSKKKDEIGAKVVSTVLKGPMDNEERQTQEVSRVYNVLKKKYNENGKRPICYYSFVINPDSYTYTIENIFHTSFLIQVLRAQILEDKNGLPVIIPRVPEVGDREVQNSQCVVAVSTEEFKDLVKAFDIKKSCIPTPQVTGKRKESG